MIWSDCRPETVWKCWQLAATALALKWCALCWGFGIGEEQARKEDAHCECIDSLPCSCLQGMCVPSDIKQREITMTCVQVLKSSLTLLSQHDSLIVTAQSFWALCGCVIGCINCNVVEGKFFSNQGKFTSTRLSTWGRPLTINCR